MTILCVPRKRARVQMDSSVQLKTLPAEVRNWLPFETYYNMTYILRMEPVMDVLCKHLNWKELYNLRNTSTAGWGAIVKYISNLRTLDVNSEQFLMIPDEKLILFLSYTTNLRTLVVDTILEYEDINDIIFNNPRLYEFSGLPVRPFYQLLSSANVKLAYLKRLTFTFPGNDEGENDVYDAQFMGKFFACLIEVCISLSHLTLDGRENVVLDDNSLSCIGWLPLEEFRATFVNFSRARLSGLLYDCPNLKKIELHGCTDCDYAVSDVAYNCRSLEHFYFYADDTEVSDIDHSSDATTLVERNPNLRSFHLSRGELFTTCNSCTLDAMTHGLENLQHLSFQYMSSHIHIENSFFRLIKKFDCLLTLHVTAYHIPQTWLNQIGANCSNLNELQLFEADGTAIGNLTDEATPFDIVQLCKKNKNLEKLDLTMERSITPDGCRALVEYSTKLQSLVLVLPTSSTIKECREILESEFDLVKDRSENQIIILEYSRP